MATNIPSESAKWQAKEDVEQPPFASYNIRRQAINEGPGVHLRAHQKLVVGSVLDLFEGNVTLKHLSLWSPTATFTDPLTVAQGYDRFAAQWYGLAALFRPIQLQNYKVVSDGNPVELELSNKYVVKGIKHEQVIDSKVVILIGADGKIERLEDRWNGKLPEGVVSETFRKLNGVVVPKFVTVPKTHEEDQKLQMEKDKPPQS